jgi:hypothetical protein
VQKLVEAKLKRVQQEGMAARSQGQMMGSLPEVAHVAGEETEDRGALADANMAALLEQVQLENQWCPPPHLSTRTSTSIPKKMSVKFELK